MPEFISSHLAILIIATISALGYTGIVSLMAAESACIPIPSEVIIPFAGYLVSTGRFNLLAVALAGAIGCNLGSTAAYLVGAKGGRRLVERWGSTILLSHAELDRADHYFAKYGGITVFVGRLLPVVRTFISLPAGIAKMPVWRFQLFSFLGSLLWCLALGYAGMKLGQAWDSNPQFKAMFHSFDWLVMAIVGGAIVWCGWNLFRRLTDRRRSR
jgi:membrane protein DedA with SNARE-associated domain